MDRIRSRPKRRPVIKRVDMTKPRTGYSAITCMVSMGAGKLAPKKTLITIELRVRRIIIVILERIIQRLSGGRPIKFAA